MKIKKNSKLDKIINLNNDEIDKVLNGNEIKNTQ